MNELAQFVPLIFEMQACRIMDRNGNPWFAGRNACKILGIKRIGHTFDDFPQDEKSYVVCEVLSIYGTYRSAKSRARKTQKVLVINESGLIRLILKSRKPEAGPFKDRIITFMADIINQCFRQAALSIPNASYGGFSRPLPAMPPVPPEKKDKQEEQIERLCKVLDCQPGDIFKAAEDTER